MNNERYFIAFFKFYKGDGKQGDIVNTIITSGGYLNYKTAIEEVKEGAGIEKVVITNIIELPESDYMDFIKDYNDAI